MRAESVAWVTERKDTTSGLFWMLSLLAYAAYVRRPGPARSGLLCLAFALGLMSKTMLVSLPLVLLLLDVWPLERWRPFAGDGASLTPQRASPGRLIVEKLPLFGLVAVGCVLAVLTQSTIGGVRSLGQVSLGWRLTNTALAYVAYLLQTAWPIHLAVIYPHPALIGATHLADQAWPAIGATALLTLISGLCLMAAPRRPYLAVGWLWYLITLVPVIGLFQVGHQSHADRYSYLPLIGVYVMVVWGLRDVVSRWPRLRVPVVAATTLVVAALSALSWRQIATWENSRTVFEHAIAVTEDNYFAHQTLGAELLAKGELDAARRHLSEAIRIKPDSAYAHEQLGLLLEAQGDREASAAAYETALQLSDMSELARTHLAYIRLAQGRSEQTIELLRSALKHEPDNSQLSFELGTLLLQLKRYAEAVVYLERTLSLAPDAAEAHNNLGVALAYLGRLDEAATHLERTLALRPGDAVAAGSFQQVRELQARH